MTRYLLTTLCSLCAACALLLVGGCDYQGDSLAADYGYVQFHLVKASQLTEEDTRADKLEWLSDACKIKVVMQLDGSTITQTLCVDSYDKESAEWGLWSEKLRLLTRWTISSVRDYEGILRKAEQRGDLVVKE